MQVGSWNIISSKAMVLDAAVAMPVNRAGGGTCDLTNSIFTRDVSACFRIC